MCFQRDDAGGFWSRKGHFVLDLKDEKPARVRDCFCVFYNTGHMWHRGWEIPKKTKQKVKTHLQLPASKQLKPLAPPIPFPVLRE